MDDTLNTIRQRLIELGAKGRRVVAAVSGGPDSMAMLHMLLCLRDELGLRLEAAHFNHQLRPTAQRDEDIVRAYCRRQHIGLHACSQDIAALGGNTENAGREARYAFMLGLLGSDDLLATAHHQGDLAESVLMNIIRGAGTRGLAGIRPRRGQIIRPLLNLPKADISEYIRANHIPYGLDETNDSPDYTRNRVRLELIPTLQRDYNPAIVPALERLARHAAEDEGLLSGLAAEALSGLELQGVGDIYRGFDGRAVAALHPALGKRLLRLLMEGMGRYDMDESAIAGCWEAMGSNARVDIGQGLFAKGGERAELYRLLPLQPALEIGGEGVYQSGHWWLEVRAVPRPEIFSARQDWTQHINIGYIDKIPLMMRTRQPGDSLRRGSGSKKLGDIMTDRKTPTTLRNALPVLVAGGELLWAVGVDMAEHARVGSEDRALRLEFCWID